MSSVHFSLENQVVSVKCLLTLVYLYALWVLCQRYVSNSEIFIHVFMIPFLRLLSLHALCVTFSNYVAAKEVNSENLSKKQRTTPQK